MLFSTPTQFAVLALALIAGWLLGLASHPGGRKWKERYSAEREAHAAARKDADDRIAIADKRALEADRRFVEAEQLREAPVVERDLAVGTRTETVAMRPVDATSSRPFAASSARPAYPSDGRRGWFDWGDRTTVG
ncbi:hypothetical protein ASG67_03630 [Sphingomonas sp. Leaf339]|uniref:hypothetical protein n=1 Tax=Sphingomonas sp. Leaf339 TaxID=1736343 RepID=UPI00070177E2|nr:hypothetical protein [Sphingomonas sp. Leaf339]KQU62218.1 hypothetical protein ASG67_03630 [Sphingomonas sp. Leaf339]